VAAGFGRGLGAQPAAGFELRVKTKIGQGPLINTGLGLAMNKIFEVLGKNKNYISTMVQYSSTVLEY
jgi:hypothetical protein